MQTYQRFIDHTAAITIASPIDVKQHLQVMVPDFHVHSHLFILSEGVIDACCFGYLSVLILMSSMLVKHPNRQNKCWRYSFLYVTISHFFKFNFKIKLCALVRFRINYALAKIATNVAADVQTSC